MWSTGGGTACRTRKYRPYVAVFRIHGPFLFCAADKMDRGYPTTAGVAAGDYFAAGRNMTAIDATGMQSAGKPGGRGASSAQGAAIVRRARKPRRC